LSVFRCAWLPGARIKTTLASEREPCCSNTDPRRRECYRVRKMNEPFYREFAIRLFPWYLYLGPSV